MVTNKEKYLSNEAIYTLLLQFETELQSGNPVYARAILNKLKKEYNLIVVVAQENNVTTSTSMEQ